jgi:hypothetical protein
MRELERVWEETGACLWSPEQRDAFGRLADEIVWDYWYYMLGHWLRVRNCQYTTLVDDTITLNRGWYVQEVHCMNGKHPDAPGAAPMTVVEIAGPFETRWEAILDADERSTFPYKVDDAHKDEIVRAAHMAWLWSPTYARDQGYECEDDRFEDAMVELGRLLGEHKALIT